MTKRSTGGCPPADTGGVPKLDPEVEVELLDNGEWRRGFAYFRQQLDDGWWYNVRLVGSLAHSPR